MSVTASNPKLEKALRDLILKREFSRLILDQQLEYFCQTVCREVNVARVGIWMLSDDQEQIVSRIEWDSVKNRAKSGTVLRSADAACYLEAIRLEIVLVIDDAMNDPRCAELARSYLPDNDIRSMLDCPLYGAEGLIGVMCVEHVGELREWTEDERSFVSAVASLVSLCYEVQARREAENAKEEREQRLAQYSEMCMGWMFETDETLSVVAVSGEKPVRRLDLASLVGKKPWEFMDLLPLSGSWEQVRARMHARESFQDVILYATDSEGDRAYTEISGRPRFDDAGKFTGYVGIARDVTARVKSQIELRASEQRYRSASRLGRFGYWIWDEIEDRASYCSPELADIYGVTVEEYLERSSSLESDLTWFHPDDRDRYERVIKEAVKHRTGYELTARIVRNDGSVRHLHEWTEAVFDEAGKFVATAGVLMDITDRVELQEKLREQSEHLQSLVDNLPGAVFRVSSAPGWPIKYVSQGYYRSLVDPSADEQSPGGNGNDDALRVDPEYRRIVDEERRKSIEEDRFYEIEYKVRVGNGNVRWVWERGRPIRTSDREVELEGLLLDITDKRNAQNALMKSQKLEAVGQLTGGIAHDFNNLLAVILGNLELIRMQTNESSIDEMLNNCINATQRGADLTRSLLAFAKRADLRPSEMDLNAVLEETREWIGRTLPANIQFTTQLSPGLWTAEADQAGTETALLNLILNARDAMPGGGHLTLVSENVVVGNGPGEIQDEELEPGKYVLLSVSDTGNGIPGESLNAIFEPFHTTKAPGEGTGLGLSMVQGFMAQSGGKVSVHSEQGVGTTFKLYFPTVERSDGSNVSDETLHPVNSLRSGRILLVEDNASFLDVLKQNLKSAGHDVVGVNSADKGLEVFGNDREFDLVITDVVMPGRLMGPEFAKEIRSLVPGVPVLFISGYPDNGVGNSDRFPHDAVFLAKPFRVADLVSTVERMLSGPSTPGRT